MPVAAKRQPKTEYFKPADWADAWAIFIEVKRDAPNSTNNFKETKDAVYADLTIFATEADLETGGKVYRNERIDAPLLQRTLREDCGVGNADIRVLSRWGDKRMWVWRYPEDSVRDKVIAWYDAREADVADTSNVPDYLKD